jgi:ribonuclease HII
MDEKREIKIEEIYSKVLRSGRRTYFFDVRETKANDYYLTITESKKFTNEDGSYHYKKHKIYLYKEAFKEFKEFLEDTINYIVDKKGEGVISERHQADYKAPEKNDEKTENISDFSNLDFDEL